MAKCAYCNKTLLFGGKKEGDLRFCNEICRQKGQVILVADQIPDDVVRQHSMKVRTGPCPKCKQSRGPVDVYTSHRVWSIIIRTSWVSVPQISCRPCGVKAMLYATVTSFLCGWWGFPFGIAITPLQIVKNIWGLARSREALNPSSELERMVRMNLASYALAHPPKS